VNVELRAPLRVALAVDGRLAIRYFSSSGFSVSTPVLRRLNSVTVRGVRVGGAIGVERLVEVHLRELLERPRLRE
jgi:hypothetical protein